jgi:DNA modification methylase
MHYVTTEPPSTKAHPCAKPQKAWEWICVRASTQGQTILDPFMGSGTTLVACQKLGRAGTGIEIDPEYFEIACRRVDEAARQPDMLIDVPPPKPVQEGLEI